METIERFLEIANRISLVVEAQNESSKEIFKSQVDVINKQVEIINRQITIIEKQHEDNIALADKLLNMTDK